MQWLDLLIDCATLVVVLALWTALQRQSRILARKLK